MLSTRRVQPWKTFISRTLQSSLKFVLLKPPFVWNSCPVFTKPLPLPDNNSLPITNECSRISLLIVTCSQAVESHGLLIMPDPQMELCGTIKLHTLSVSFLISEWVMPYICRAELLFLFLRAAIDRPADVNSDCAAHHSFGRISRLGANLCTKAAGTPGSLLLELAPSKTVLGVDFIFLY